MLRRVTSVISLSFTNGTCGKIQKITCMPKFTALCEHPLLCEVLQIAGRCRTRSRANTDVVFSAQATLESGDALTEHAGDDLGLAFVEFFAVILIKFGFRHVEINTLDSVVLRLKNRIGEVFHPIGDFESFVVSLQRRVIILAFELDRIGKRDQARLSQILRESFFSKRARDAPVAIFKWMDAHEIKMNEGRAGQWL